MRAAQPGRVARYSTQARAALRPAPLYNVFVLFTRLLELSRAGRPAAIATVVRTQGSTPQVVGAKLIALDDEKGRAAGTLGGGCVEADAILAARDVIRNGGRSLRAYDLSEDLAWNTGLVCGGTMWILAERADDALRAGDGNRPGRPDRLPPTADRRPRSSLCSTVVVAT